MNVSSHFLKFLHFSNFPPSLKHSKLDDPGTFLNFFTNQFKESADKKRSKYFLLLMTMWLLEPLCKRDVSRLGLLPQKFVNLNISIENKR